MRPAPTRQSGQDCGESNVIEQKKPRVSIGVPVRNGERYLAEALDSLLGQTYKDFELLISDNASTDQTESICREYAEKDGRVRYYRSRYDVGLANNYNFLFLRARGEYFKWAAADDVHEPDYVARCLEVLDSDPTTVLAYGKARFIDQNGESLDDIDPGYDLRSDDADERLRYVISSSHWVNAIFGLIRPDALARTQLMPSYAGADYTLLGELALAGKFVEVGDPLLRRRLHPGASSQNTDANWMSQFWTGGGGISLPVWSRTRDHFATILRSNLGTKEDPPGRITPSQHGLAKAKACERAAGSLFSYLAHPALVAFPLPRIALIRLTALHCRTNITLVFASIPPAHRQASCLVFTCGSLHTIFFQAIWSVTQRRGVMAKNKDVGRVFVACASGCSL